MKLVGSATENKIREVLISSASYVLSNLPVLLFLEKMFGPLSSAYVLSHTPDQSEDFYVILINGSIVVRFELSREHKDAEPENLSVVDIGHYRKSLRGRHAQLKFSIAMELALRG